MAQLLAPNLFLVPYGQASPTQLAKAVYTAREALGPQYADLPWPQWYEAFAYFQPILRLEAGQVYVTVEGLLGLTQYFGVRHSASAPTSQLPPAAVAPPSGLEEVPGSPVLPAQLPKVKRTYSIDPDVLESLERVSFWRRDGKSDLVNLAMHQLLATYSESQIPLPPAQR